MEKEIHLGITDEIEAEITRFHDAHEKLIEERRTTEDEPSIRVKYTYDAAGNLQLEEFFEADKVKLSYAHTYDDHNHRIKTCEAEGVEREVFMTTSFTYNTEGQKTSQKCTPRIRGLCNSDQFWTYDAQGFLVRE